MTLNLNALLALAEQQPKKDVPRRNDEFVSVIRTLHNKGYKPNDISAWLKENAGVNISSISVGRIVSKIKGNLI